MQYFNNCSTLEEVKTLYKNLAKTHHPDVGGDTPTMQAINTEYAFACAKILHGENLSSEEINDEINMSETYRQVIEQIINLPGILIQIVGMYIWVTGATYPVRKELKAANLCYHGKKECWFYADAKYRVRGGKQSLDEICAKYGSTTVNSKQSGKVLR